MMVHSEWTNILRKLVIPIIFQNESLKDCLLRLLNLLSFALALNCFGNKIRPKFDWGYLKQDKITFNHVKIVNVYIVYALSSNLNNFNSTLKNCLFVAVKLTKNTDTDKYKYSGYGIGFDSCRIFSFPSCKFTQNVIIFAVDMR